MTERTTVEFNDDETRAVHQLAEWFANACLAHGLKPPPDPMRALLVAAYSLHQRCAFLEAILEANDINAGDYAPPTETMQ